MSRSSSDIATPAGCVCQDQHRRGYCTEPGCPYSNPLSRSSAEREQALEAINEMEGWVAILWQNAKRANRYSDDGVTQDGAGHIADAIERWLKPIRAALDVAQPSPAIEARLADAYAALRSIAEGNLGEASWQANYETIKQVARNALTLTSTQSEASK